MTLKTRIMICTMCGLVGFLLVYSMLIYVFFIRETTDAEVRMLWNRAQTVLRKPEVRQPPAWSSPRLLDEFLSDHMMLRIIGPDGSIRTEARNDDRLIVLKPVYRTTYHTGITARGVERYVSIQVPIIRLPEMNQVGTLELAKAFSLFHGYLRMLILTLGTGFLIGSAFSVILGLLYVRWIYRPIAALAQTMERIERGGRFDRLDETFTSSGDEFGRLGLAFNRMIARLEDNYERQRHFVQDASHELRTPLTVISSYAGMLERWGVSDPALLDEAVEAIRQEADRLKELVDGLLRLAWEEGPAPEILAFVPLWKLVRRTAEELSRTFGRKVVVEAAEDAKVSAVEGEPLRLKQMLIILLDNALKYSTETVTIRLATEREGILLEVEDQGIGIAEEQLEKLFDRFYRVDQARARDTGGSGLGLSIARKIVEDQQGTIGVRSRPGEGSVFSVWLPCRRKVE